MTVSSEEERTRGGRRRHATARIALFFFFIVLIFSQLFSSFAQNDKVGGSGQSPARKTRVFGTVPVHAASIPPTHLSGTDDDDSDDIYDDDKRIVHTGPNPLHN
ncbi:unnamed protein product [Ilex paraguariensis]|uniref:Uncharacterized protein n=1 Tax=Ilex paraguariensis TaxID=185542 RepID=A0ABC8SF92_9AQUA